MVDTYWVVVSFDNYGVGQYISFRLEIAEGTQFVDRKLFGKCELTLLLRGCAIGSSYFQLDTAKQVGLERIIDFHVSPPGEPLPALDGFKLDFDGKSNSSSPLRFTLAGSDDNWTTSVPVASSEFRLVPEGVRMLGGSSAAWAAGGALLFENSLSWSLILSAAVHPILFSLLCASAALCGALNRPLAARQLTALFCALIAANMFAAVLGGAGPRVQNVSNGATAAAFVALGAVLALDECHVPASFALLGLLVTAARVLEDVLVFDDAAYLASSPPYSSAAIALVGLILVAQPYGVMADVIRRRRAAQETQS